MTDTASTAGTAPVISRNSYGWPYPQRGKVIGPAWEIMWQLFVDLGPDEWISRAEVIDAVTAAHPISPAAAANLVHSARAAGLLDVRHISGRYRRAEYRRNPAYRGEVTAS